MATFQAVTGQRALTEQRRVGEALWQETRGPGPGRPRCWWRRHTLGNRNVPCTLLPGGVNEPSRFASVVYTRPGFGATGVGAEVTLSEVSRWACGGV